MPDADAKQSEPLSRDRVLAGAVALADADGLAAVTIRSLANTLDVKPMSLYHYIHGKEDLLDGMVDRVFSEIKLPDVEGPWRAEIRGRAVSARAVLARHPWALAVMETRSSPGPATLRHHDAVVGVLTNSGFSLAMTARAYTIIDAYVYGFVLQEASLPLDDPHDAAEAITTGPGSASYPHLAAFVAEHLMRPGYSFREEFEPGLDVVLDAVETLARR